MIEAHGRLRRRPIPTSSKRFVDASIIGWYNYLYGDNKAANDLIKKDNPDMTDDQIAFSIAKMKEYGLRRLRRRAGEAASAASTDASVKDFYDKMVEAGVVKAGLDLSEGLHRPSSSARASAWS